MDKFKMLENKLHDLIIEGKYIIITADLYSIIKAINDNVDITDDPGLAIPDYLTK